MPKLSSLSHKRRQRKIVLMKEDNVGGTISVTPVYKLLIVIKWLTHREQLVLEGKFGENFLLFLLLYPVHYKWGNNLHVLSIEYSAVKVGGVSLLNGDVGRKMVIKDRLMMLIIRMLDAVILVVES